MASIQILSAEEPTESHPCILHVRVLSGSVHVGMSVRFGNSWKIWYPSEIYRIEPAPDGAPDELILHLEAELYEAEFLLSGGFCREHLFVTWEPL